MRLQTVKLVSDDSERATTTAPDPAGDEDLVSALRLALVSGIGPRMTVALLGHFGSAAAVLAAAPAFRTYKGSARS